MGPNPYFLLAGLLNKKKVERETHFTSPISVKTWKKERRVRKENREGELEDEGEERKLKAFHHLYSPHSNHLLFLSIPLPKSEYKTPRLEYHHVLEVTFSGTKKGNQALDSW